MVNSLTSTSQRGGRGTQYIRCCLLLPCRIRRRHTYIHTYMHVYIIHTNIHAHTCNIKHTYIHACLCHIYIRTYVHATCVIICTHTHATSFGIALKESTRTCDRERAGFRGELKLKPKLFTAQSFTNFSRVAQCSQQTKVPIQFVTLLHAKQLISNLKPRTRGKPLLRQSRT